MINPAGKYVLLNILIAILFLFHSCNSTVEDDSGDGTTYSYDFYSGTEGWINGFADYPVGEENFYELSFAHSKLPQYLGNKYGLYISGNNHSDDLFMYIKRQFTNLKANTSYAVRFNVEIASDALESIAGIGGSPGASVYLHAGATVEEPESIIIHESDLQDNYYRMNIDKGNQSYGGADSIVLGNIGISDQNPDQPYKLKALGNNMAITVSTDNTGILWIFIGTDSGFEGVTSIYFSSIKITLTEQ
ncbi:MAG: PEP-CTERM sorting domain-containing protein [Candidatus Latescibacteria bacterium]|nr:PEP-CTERM sorting domain-containing protein [Candidatus Latescibacterota bacterium]